jgi:hypothetical protein
MCVVFPGEADAAVDLDGRGGDVGEGLYGVCDGYGRGDPMFRRPGGGGRIVSGAAGVLGLNRLNVAGPTMPRRRYAAVMRSSYRSVSSPVIVDHPTSPQRAPGKAHRPACHAHGLVGRGLHADSSAFGSRTL